MNTFLFCIVAILCLEFIYIQLRKRQKFIRHFIEGIDYIIEGNKIKRIASGSMPDANLFPKGSKDCEITVNYVVDPGYKDFVRNVNLSMERRGL